MATIEQGEVKHALVQALVYLEADGRGETVASIRPIIFENLERGGNPGRVHYYLRANPGSTIRDYVHLVANCYDSLSRYLYQLQEEKCDEVWEPLFVKLQWLAYNYLRQKNFSPGQQTFQLARDCAADAGGELVAAYFPYDTEFEPWVCILVQNHCKKAIGRLLRAGQVPDQQLVPLADLSHRTVDLGGDNITEWRLTLRHLIDQLPAEQLETVLLHDFEGMTLKEIGRHLGISTTTAQRRYFAAIDFLRKKLA